jgi:hypothetical protein
MAPSGPQWIHEIKHDGYRMIARRQGDRVRVWSRNGKEWTHSFPLIRAALLGLPVESVVMDGEAVAHCEHGLPDFHGLKGEGADTACLYGFDLLIIDGEDLRGLPLIQRKTRLKKLLRTAPAGIIYTEHFDDEGPTIFDHVCRLGLEGVKAQGRAVSVGAHQYMAEGQKSGIRASVTRERCLYCLHWRGDDDNPDAAERELQMRFGPEVALGGDCTHAEHRRATNSRWWCPD